MPMESTQLLLNDQLVTISADPLTTKRLTEDDAYLADYVNRAAKAGQFHFLFAKDPSLRRIVVKRLPTTSISVWCKKGRPSEADNAASVLLLKLRNSEKYAARIKEGGAKNSRVWEEIAAEMRAAGYDVDAQKCAQKLVSLVQNYQKKGEWEMEEEELKAELRKVCGEVESEEEDEEWLPRSKRRKRDEDEVDFFKKYLKKNNQVKEEKYKEMCELIRRRNELFEQKIKQNKEILAVLSKLLKNYN